LRLWRGRGRRTELRNHVRGQEYNNGFVAGPIRRIRNNVVGQGIRFQARVKADEKPPYPTPKINERMAETFNRDMEKFMKRWMKQADVRLIHNGYRLQGIIQEALERDGEILVIGRDSRRKTRYIPYCQEVVEADRLRTPPSEINNPRIREGIRYDDEGVPESYFILKQHPGESYQFHDSAFEEISAYHANGCKKVLHLFDPSRPEQLRGFSRWAAGLRDIQDLERYMDAEKMAALESACLTGIVKTENPGGYWNQNTKQNRERRIHEFAPGKWHYLNEGESAEILNPSRPNQSFGDYIDQLIRGPANALDIPPEVFSQKWDGMNYSNARTVLLQFYLSCRIRQAYLISDYCGPTYENAACQAISFRLVRALGFDMRRDDWLDHQWIPPGWTWVDPVKEAGGKKIDVDEGFDTQSSVLASQGRDFDDWLSERARELKKIKEMEERDGIKFKQQPASAVPSEEETEEEPEEEDTEDERTVLSVI